MTTRLTQGAVDRLALEHPAGTVLYDAQVQGLRVVLGKKTSSYKLVTSITGTGKWLTKTRLRRDGPATACETDQVGRGYADSMRLTNDGVGECPRWDPFSNWVERKGAMAMAGLAPRLQLVGRKLRAYCPGDRAVPGASTRRNGGVGDDAGHACGPKAAGTKITLVPACVQAASRPGHVPL